MVLVCGCTTTFPEVQRVDRVAVRDNQSHPIAEISAADRIEKLQQFINARRTGWQVPLGGAPVPTLIANLYADGQFVGHFGAGANFFACHRDGGFYSRSASEAELNEFRNLIRK